jgi:hypothetical protein
VKADAEIRLETKLAVTAEWPESLEVCVVADGRHFELHCYKWKLNLLQIYYLARKVDILFHFPSRSQ